MCDSKKIRKPLNATAEEEKYLEKGLNIPTLDKNNKDAGQGNMSCEICQTTRIAIVNPFQSSQAYKKWHNFHGG